MTSTHDLHVVILTGGGQPGQEDTPPGPHRTDIALALDRAGISVLDQEAIMAGAAAGTLTPANALMTRVAAEAFKAGYRRAALLHRVVAVFAVPDGATAGRFAAYLTAEVDPAYARRAADPAAELLACWERSRAGQGPA